MQRIGFWKTTKGYISHKKGLTQEQVQSLQNLKVGDRLVLFVNDVREGETGAVLSLVRSNLGVQVRSQTPQDTVTVVSPVE